MEEKILLANENEELCIKVRDAIVYWFDPDSTAAVEMKMREFAQVLDPEATNHSPAICAAMAADVGLSDAEFADKYISLNFAELLPEKWGKLLEKRTIAETVKVSMVGNSTKKCRKCGSTNTHVTLVQSRCADEGMTGKYVCLNCDARWNN